MVSVNEIVHGSNHYYGVRHYFYKVVNMTETSVTLQPMKKAYVKGCDMQNAEVAASDQVDPTVKKFVRKVKKFSDGEAYCTGENKYVFIDLEKGVQAYDKIFNECSD